jgi:hypothetical protein
LLSFPNPQSAIRNPQSKNPQSVVAATTAVRRALLVGISKYQRGRGGMDWDDLNSEPDVDSLREVLIARFQFRAEDIKVLKSGAETTHRAIVETFRRFLVEQTKPGDIAYFHYSGHGGQVPDTDVPGNPSVGDELDGLDEGLIPSDYVSKDDGSKTIRDDELGILLDELKRRQPANVTVSVDSCFSGTVTRSGRFKVRGQRWTGASPRVSATATRGGGAEESAGGFLSRGEAAAKGYVVISATRHDELASEYEDEHGTVRGLLSYALVKALSEATPETTYRDIFERINEEMSADNGEQNPQLEGDLDKVLLSGVALAPQSYFPVVVNSDGDITLQAGALQGMTEGSRFALFPPGTRSFAPATPQTRAATGDGSDGKGVAPLAEAVIVRLGSTTAALKLSDEAVAGGIKPEHVHTARAVETLHRYGDNRLRVALHGFATHARADELARLLRALPLVRHVSAAGDAWDVRLCEGRCPDEKNEKKTAATVAAVVEAGAVVLQREDGSVVATATSGARQPEEIKNALEGEARWRFINALVNRNPHSKIRIEMRVVAVEVELDKASGLVNKILRDKELRQTDGGRLEFSEGEHVMVELRNTGASDAFVTVLDLQNDGSINPLWPHPEVPKAQENKIPADRRWHRLPWPFVFRIEKPYGREIYKAIATDAPADFSPLLDKKFLRRSMDAAQQKAAATPLGQLLQAAADGQPSTRAAGVNPSDWATANAIFFVKPHP